MHQPTSLKRSLPKQQVALYGDRVRERVRQGHQLVGLFRRHGVFVKAADLIDDEAWLQQLRRLPKERTLHRGVERIRSIYLLMVEQEDSLRKERTGLAQ